MLSGRPSNSGVPGLSPAFVACRVAKGPVSTPSALNVLPLAPHGLSAVLLQDLTVHILLPISTEKLTEVKRSGAVREKFLGIEICPPYS